MDRSQQYGLHVMIVPAEEVVHKYKKNKIN